MTTTAADPIAALTTARDLAVAISERVIKQINPTSAPVTYVTPKRLKAEAMLKMQERYLDRVEHELRRREARRRAGADPATRGSAVRAERAHGVPIGEART